MVFGAGGGYPFGGVDQEAILMAKESIAEICDNARPARIECPHGTWKSWKARVAELPLCANEGESVTEVNLALLHCCSMSKLLRIKCSKGGMIGANGSEWACDLTRNSEKEIKKFLVHYSVLPCFQKYCFGSFRRVYPSTVLIHKECPISSLKFVWRFLHQVVRVCVPR